MNKTTKIIIGIALLAFGIGWALDLMGVLNLNFRFDGWWTLFIIIPCLAALIDSKHKTGALIGLGVGILMLLATLQIITWNDLWKYLLCVMAVIWGLSMLFGNKCCHNCTCQTSEPIKQIEQDGRQIQQINVNFGKHEYSFGGQRFEGAKVQTSFGFTGIDLRGADIVDGAVVNIECSFGGMELRVDKGVCVDNAIVSSFAGVECNILPTEGAKTIHLKGHCSFGGIEIK